jgi:hypothetical protein
MADSNAEVIRLLTEIKESLKRQFQGLADRFDAQATRLDRHAADIQSGRRYFAKSGEWQDNIEGHIDSLMKRVAKLEEGKSPAA